MCERSNRQQGFTIIELAVTMGIFAIITSLVTINLLNAQHIASIDTTATTLVADLKQQQVKAMTWDTEGRGVQDSYGVHFETNKYFLFHGTTYTTGEPSNFEVALEGSLIFTGTGDAIFAEGSGEKTGLGSITLRDTLTNKQKVITINDYGVITDVN
jgi:prepilin-type N-terminal cleavage/methylation domain-containing protein